jgi:polysaccharide chain length determinant protein (PEP-CTERM system associated)
MATNLSESLRLLALEAYKKRYLVVGVFAVIATLTTLVGVYWPKKYTSYSTVYIEDQSVLEPLLHGAAAPSTLRDRAMIAREVVYGRKLLDKALSTAWEIDEDDEETKGQIIEGVKKRTLVTNVGDNLVRIEYSDMDPARSRLVAQKMAELFISESLLAKSRESASAFAFIDQQVGEYQKKLRTLQNELKNFRNSNVDAQLGAEADSAHRLTELRDRLVQLDQDMREAEIRKSSLQSQLSAEADASNVLSRSDEYRRRIAELRTQLDTLRLTYRESYPDVVHLNDQIRELERAAVAADKGGRAGSERNVGQEPLLTNPVYQELRRTFYETNTTVRTLSSRIGETRRLIEQEEARSRRIQAASAQLADFMRDYDVNEQLYQDLLRRREAARVSMSLDRTQEGVTMRVEEPAVMPHSAEGPSLVYFMLGGVVAGILLPFGLVFSFQQVDPRVRHSSAIQERLGLAVLGVVPHLHTPREGAAEARGAFSLGLIVLATLAIVAAIGAMRFTGAL